jgi:hypothetical protein
MKRISYGLIALISCLFFSTAQAAFINNSTIAFVPKLGQAFSINTGTKVADFTNTLNGVTATTTGDINSFLSMGNEVRFFDFSYANLMPAAPFTLWALPGNIEFWASSFTSVTTAPSIITFDGLGFFKEVSTGDEVASDWTLSFLMNPTTGQALSWFSSSRTSIDEPYAFLLVGLFTALLGLTRHRRKIAAQ